MFKLSKTKLVKYYNCIGIILVLLLTLNISGYSQDSLSLKNILKIGLEKNYSILIARNQEEITQNNLSYAKYAFIPTASATGRNTNSIVDTRQVFASGTTQERENAKSNALTGAVNLDWTVFDGFGMFVGYNKVRELSELGKLNTRMNVENLAAQISSEYYNFIRQNQLLKAMSYGMKLSSERLEIASEKYKIGSFSRLEFLQAQVDYNADSSQYIRQEEAVIASRIQLGKILAYKLNFPDNWDDSIITDRNLILDNLLRSTLDKNTSLLIASQNQILSQLDVKAIRSRYYPSITLNSAYNYTNSESQAGFALSNRTTGITYGATVNFNILNRLDNQRQMRNAKIIQKNSDLEYENLKLEITSELNQVWNNYSNNLRVLSLETQNLQSSQENLDIAMAKYRLGGLAGIEMREIQKNFLDANNRYITAQYLAKIAEITLKQISGNIEEYF